MLNDEFEATKEKYKNDIAVQKVFAVFEEAIGMLQDTQVRLDSLENVLALQIQLYTKGGIGEPYLQGMTNGLLLAHNITNEAHGTPATFYNADGTIARGEEVVVL